MIAVTTRDALDTDATSLYANAKWLRLSVAAGLAIHQPRVWVPLLAGRVVAANLQRLVSTMEPVDPIDIELFASLSQRIAESSALIQRAIDLNLPTRWFDRRLLSAMSAWRDQVDDIAETLMLGGDQACKDEIAKAVATIQPHTTDLDQPHDWRRVLADL